MEKKTESTKRKKPDSDSPDKTASDDLSVTGAAGTTGTKVLPPPSKQTKTKGQRLLGRLKSHLVDPPQGYWVIKDNESRRSKIADALQPPQGSPEPPQSLTGNAPGRNRKSSWTKL